MKSLLYIGFGALLLAIGAGSTLSISIFATCRNPIMTNVLISRALIGSPSVEVSGSIGSVYSLLILYAFSIIHPATMSIDL